MGHKELEAGSRAALEGHARGRVACRNVWAEAIHLQALGRKLSAAWKGPIWVADIWLNEGRGKTSHHRLR
jgi:ribosomal protein S28E/S33